MPKKMTPEPSPITEIPRVKRSYKSRKRKLKKAVVKPVAKRTSKRVDPIFASTLRAAEERFVELTARQQELVYELTMVQAELPAVQATMYALRAQLNPKFDVVGDAMRPFTVPQYQQEPILAPQSIASSAQQALARILPLPARKPGKGFTSSDAMSVARLVTGPLKGMGSIPASQVHNPVPVELASENETLVDEFGGEELIPDAPADHKVG